MKFSRIEAQKFTDIKVVKPLAKEMTRHTIKKC